MGIDVDLAYPEAESHLSCEIDEENRRFILHDKSQSIAFSTSAAWVTIEILKNTLAKIRYPGIDDPDSTLNQPPLPQPSDDNR